MALWLVKSMFLQRWLIIQHPLHAPTVSDYYQSFTVEKQRYGYSETHNCVLAVLVLKCSGEVSSGPCNVSRKRQCPMILQHCVVTCTSSRRPPSFSKHIMRPHWVLSLRLIHNRTNYVPVLCQEWLQLAQSTVWHLLICCWL